MVGCLRLTRSLVGAGLLLALGSAGALAFDASPLPQDCKDTLAAMQGEKARFGQIGKAMAAYRKASDNANFCQAAREIVTMIKAQNDRLAGCIGELASAPVPQSATNQMLALRATYKQMLDAAKDPRNDHLKCGLANQ